MNFWNRRRMAPQLRPNQFVMLPQGCRNLGKRWSIQTEKPRTRVHLKKLSGLVWYNSGKKENVNTERNLRLLSGSCMGTRGKANELSSEDKERKTDGCPDQV